MNEQENEKSSQDQVSQDQKSVAYLSSMMNHDSIDDRDAKVMEH